MKEKVKIAIVEDERLQRELLKDILSIEGFNLDTFENASSFFSAHEDKDYDIVLLDYKLTDMTGMDVLRELKQISPITQVIIITAFADVEIAVEAMKEGAFDFLKKPIKKDELIVRLKKAIEFLNLNRELQKLRENIEAKGDVKDFVYKSKKMENIVKLSLKIAKSNANVLITGETGTGKERIAEIIHYTSQRSEFPLIKVNIAALPDTLIESELFGAEKGAYTGANKRMVGKFEAANGGTIFLDEIAEIPLLTQTKLLRVIQEKKVIRLGSSVPIDTDVRIITATNKDLDSLVQSKQFRNDLYYRLNVIKIELPPLRDRKEEIPYLIDFFIKKYNKRENKSIKGVSREVIRLLTKYEFPGNIRELENVIERGVILASSDYIEKDDVAPFLYFEGEPNTFSSLEIENSLPETIKKIEMKLIKDALDKSGGVKTAAAKILGISERVLRYKIEQYGIHI